MKAQQFGRIVNATSAAGLFATLGQTNYGAAKAALAGMVRVLATDGARHGNKANAIAPVARTRMTDDILGEHRDRLDPELVSPTVAWLCHEECLVSGETYSAGGGRVARVFTATTPGWFGAAHSVKQVRKNFDHIRDEKGYVIPTNDELSLLVPNFA